MSRQIDLPPQPVVTPRRRRAGEIAGGVAADCAAVCCCCPCTVMNILVLAVVRLPAGLCKRAIRRRKRHRLQKMKNGMYSQQQIIYGGNSPMTLEEHLSEEMKEDGGDDAAEKWDGGSEAARWEKEMWAQFHGTGFWRSPSQRQAP